MACVQRESARASERRGAHTRVPEYRCAVGRRARARADVSALRRPRVCARFVLFTANNGCRACAHVRSLVRSCVCVRAAIYETGRLSRQSRTRDDVFESSVPVECTPRLGASVRTTRDGRCLLASAAYMLVCVSAAPARRRGRMRARACL